MSDDIGSIVARLIGTLAMASPNDIKTNLKYLEELHGSEYYEGDYDVLIQCVINLLRQHYSLENK